MALSGVEIGINRNYLLVLNDREHCTMCCIALGHNGSLSTCCRGRFNNTAHAFAYSSPIVWNSTHVHIRQSGALNTLINSRPPGDCLHL